MAKENSDVLFISETKLCILFSDGQLQTSYFETFCWYRDEYGGSIMVFIGEDILSKLLSIEDVTAEVLSYKINPSLIK